MIDVDTCLTTLYVTVDEYDKARGLQATSGLGPLWSRAKLDPQ